MYTEYAIWAGNSDPTSSSCPYWVKKDGTFYAKNGKFSGELEAAKGTFAGELQAATGTFSGDISAASGTFKGTIQASRYLDSGGNDMMHDGRFKNDYLEVDSLNVADNFIVDENGNVTMNGDIYIAGHLTMTGDSSHWLLTRYSTNRDAPIPSGWRESWNSAWDNTNTQVWVIYSYDGGTTWTQPMLAQGKDGEKGEKGDRGSDANVPQWVQAYTANARFNTLVDNEWVVSMNLYGSRVFGGTFWDDTGHAHMELNYEESEIGTGSMRFYNENNHVVFGMYDTAMGMTSLNCYGHTFIYVYSFKAEPRGTWDFSNATVTGLTIA